MAYQELVQKAEERKAQEKTEWVEKRAKLEREKLDAREIVFKYEDASPRRRTVTDSEYREAKTKMWQAATAISEGDHEAHKPVNPLDYMTTDQLKTRLAELTDDVNKAEAQAEYEKETGRHFTIPTRDGRKMADILAIQSRLQAMEQSE